MVAPVVVPSVDLLHAAATDVGVSSAYHDDLAQVGRLFDGDPATAWNSATDELVGAHIDVRVPAGADVTSIEIIPGFAREGGDEDLFTGNHRVSRVRIAIDGDRIGDYPLDVESRALQTIPVTGGAGVWRIEVLDVVPGTHPSWRETCISELRVLGHVGTAPAGTTPTASIGAIAPPTVVAAADRAEEAIAEAAEGMEGLDEGDAYADEDPAVQALHDVVDGWRRYDSNLYMESFATPEHPAPPPAVTPPTRAEAFAALIGFVEPRAAAEVAHLRAIEAPTDFTWEARRGDLAIVVTALTAATAAGTPALHCAWNGERLELLFYRMESDLGDLQSSTDLALIDAEEPIDGPPTPAAELRRIRTRADAANAFEGWFEEIDGAWDGADPAALASLHDRPPPAILDIADAWAELLAAVDHAADDCPPPEEDLYDDSEYD